jgi:transposase
MYVRGIRSLFRFPGYVVSRISMSAEMVQVNLKRDRRYALVCPGCGGRLHRSREIPQPARDLPLGSAVLVMLIYPAIQGRCRSCGGWATIHPPGIDPHARATRRLMEFVSRAARHMPLTHVGDLLRVDDATAGRWDRIVLKSRLPPPKLDGLRILLIDEKAVRKRHGYVTLVMNGENGELLYLAEGKKKESLQGFFDQLNAVQKASIVAVAMDRAGAYYQVVKEQLPDADIVFDKFHLIANYNAVIDQVRRAEWHKAHAQDKQVIKGQRYNLFRRPENHAAAGPEPGQALGHQPQPGDGGGAQGRPRPALAVPLSRGGREVPAPLGGLGAGLRHPGPAQLRPRPAEGQDRGPELLQASHHHRAAGGVQQHRQSHHPSRLRSPRSGLPIPQAATGIH